MRARGALMRALRSGSRPVPGRWPARPPRPRLPEAGAGTDEEEAARACGVRRPRPPYATGPAGSRPRTYRAPDHHPGGAGPGHEEGPGGRRRVEPESADRLAGLLSRSALRNVLHGRRLPGEKLLAGFAAVCGTCKESARALLAARARILTRLCPCQAVQGCRAGRACGSSLPRVLCRGPVRVRPGGLLRRNALTRSAGGPLASSPPVRRRCRRQGRGPGGTRGAASGRSGGRGTAGDGRPPR